MILTAKSVDRSRSFESAIVTPPFCRYYIMKLYVFQVKYSAYAECEIIFSENCEISHTAYGSVRCEMKFAHIRVSEYFTFAKQIFHSEAISLARRANFTEKSQVLRLGFFLGRGRRTRTRDPRFWRPVLYQLSYTPVYTCSIGNRWRAMQDSNLRPTGS